MYNTEKTSDTENTTIETTESIALPHEGSWARNFEIGKDSTQYVYYTIWEDSIKYEMSGIMAMNYTIKMDTFVVADNRWIGTLIINPLLFLQKILPPILSHY